MDKVIVTVLLIIAGITASFAVFNSVYPAVERGGQSVSDAAGVLSDRISSRIEIIQAGATDTTTVDAWVKNVGAARILGIEYGDIFFGAQGGIFRIPFGNVSSDPPYWSYHLEGANTQWEQTVTNRITVHLAAPLSTGIYLFKIALPNGVFDESSFSLEE